MKVKSYKNKYMHDVADCPLCPAFVYVRPSTKLSPDPLRDLKRHITTRAKAEALAFFLDEEIHEACPHADYYKNHTKVKPLQPSTAGKRGYDEDLTI